MNVNMKSRRAGIGIQHKPTRRRRRGSGSTKTTYLVIMFIVASIAYAGWFIKLISDTNSDNENVNTNGGGGGDEGGDKNVDKYRNRRFQEFTNKENENENDKDKYIHDHDNTKDMKENENVHDDHDHDPDPDKVLEEEKDKQNNAKQDTDDNAASSSSSSSSIQGGGQAKGNPLIKLSNYQFKKQTTTSSNSINIKIKPFMAYIEKPLNNEIPNTRTRGSRQDDKDLGHPPKFIQPLPLRTTTPSDLKEFIYPKVDSCHDLQAKLPIDAGLLYETETDPDTGAETETRKRVFPNTNSHRFEFDPLEDAKYCPVDADPFLPWIHDVFPSVDGRVVHFVAQNKRRCNTGFKFGESLMRLEPQVALMQPIGVKRIDEDDENENGILEEVEGGDGLWIPNEDSKEESSASASASASMPRYRLATSPEDSDPDSKYTRFICRFHTVEYNTETGSLQDVILGETLSVYPFNYEFVNLRKRKASMLTSKGKDNGLFWLSNLRFDCPVPDNGNLRQSIADGITILEDGTPSVYVDVIPIRTNPRFGMEESYFDLDLVDADFFNNTSQRSPAFGNDNTVKFGFDALRVYGDKHVLPRVEASGRWANVPICKPPQRPPTKDELKLNMDMDESGSEGEKQLQVTSVKDTAKDADIDADADAGKPKKPFQLIACVWASATFETRGGDRKVSDTMERTREWIEYNLLMGFDHIYIYDNTHANNNETDLVETLSPFSKAEVTRIEWPSIVCNNNLPAHENTGERSSQYAAESSCRQRYGQYTEWIGAFDTDEYFVPMGKYDNIKDVVKDAAKTGTNVLSFRSTRSYPNANYMEKYGGGGECGQDDNPMCLKKRDNATFLETYNCDFHPLPKPDWSDRAKKQIYRPDYVMSHFVHYSTVTKGILETNKNHKGRRWNYWYRESKQTERFTNDLEEAVMIHSKTTVPGNTKGYFRTCMLGFHGRWTEKCRVGFPIFNNTKVVNATTPEGYERNCYTIDRVTHDYAPKLRDAMTKRTGRFAGDN